jgi:hypothetical protein
MDVADFLFVSGAALIVAAPFAPAAYRRCRQLVVERRRGSEFQPPTVPATDERKTVVVRVLRSDAAPTLAPIRDDGRAAMSDGAPPPPPPPAPPPMPPGRQRVAMPGEQVHHPLFGRISEGSGWSRPFPRNAYTANWEDVHTFAPGVKPKRDPHMGLHANEPPISLLCPGCELEQTPLTSGSRTCPYCGMRLTLFGSLVAFWREAVEAPTWSPRR